jgi:hypothetical protein
VHDSPLRVYGLSSGGGARSLGGPARGPLIPIGARLANTPSALELRVADDDLKRILGKAIAESIWSTPSVADEPAVRLRNWQVFEVNGERRVLGYHYAAWEGRLSSRIKAIEPQERRIVTRSGRVYHVEGPPGRNPDADWVLDRWMDARKVRPEDVRWIPVDELFPSDTG